MDNLDEFTQAYLTTALWSSTNDGEPLDRFLGPDDIDGDTLDVMKADCRRFQEENAVTIADAIATGKVVSGPDFGPMGRAGHDFWLTRCGHGAGFWDGDWPEPHARRLTAAAEAFGSMDLYVGGDFRIYG